MGGVIAQLAGAPQAASTAGGFYQNAANNIATQTASPEAAIFSREQMAALRPLFAQQDAELTAQNAAQGIGTSGAGRYNFGNLAGQQSATLAGSVAPLYQQAEGQYGNIIGQMPGAQTSAYQNAIQDLYQGISSAGSAAAMGMGGFGSYPGVPTMPGGGGFDPNGNYYSDTPQNAGAPGATELYG